MIRRKLYFVALLLAAFSVSIALASSSPLSASSSGTIFLLHSARINTRQTAEYHKDSTLAATHRDSNDDVNQYQYLFHYSDHYDREAVEALLGFPLRRYIPDKGWHIFTTPAKVSQLRQIRGVEWIGAYHPDYKYHETILGANPHSATRQSLHQKFNKNFLNQANDGPVHESTNHSLNSFTKEDAQDIHDIHAVLPIYHKSEDNDHAYVKAVAERLSALVKSTDASLHSRIELFAISGDTIVGHTNSEEDVQLLAKIVARDSEIYYVQRRSVFHLYNRWGRGISQTATANPNYDTLTGAITFNRPLRGEGQIIGVADSGLDWQSCFFHDTNFPNGPTLTPVGDANVTTVTPGSVNTQHRKIVQYIGYADLADDNGHGTHVCGSVAGKTSRQISFSTVNGMAYEAKLAFFDIGAGTGGRLRVPQRYDMSIFPWAYAAGARIHSNSWGSSARGYTQEASWVDTYMWNNKDFLILYAAGNDGHGPTTIGSPGTAKNTLTVGATSNSLEAWNGIFCNGGFVPRQVLCDVLARDSSGPFGEGKKNREVVFGENHVAGFSSDGPTADGRLKPDIVAPGMFILSAKNGQSASTSCTAGPGTLMNFQAGTSMATPVVAGNVALIRQWFTDGYYPTGLKRAADGFAPSASLLKAIVMAGAKPLTGNVDSNAFIFSGAPVTAPVPLDATPSNIQGNGRIEVDQSIHFAGDNHRTIILGLKAGGALPSMTKTGDTISFDVCVVDPAAALTRVALVWTDPPGQPTAETVLVNDLDLVVTVNKALSYSGNQKMGNKTQAAADHINPQEMVTPSISDNAKNTDLTIQVSAFNVPRGPQPYALVVVGNIREGLCSSGGGTPAPATEVFQWQSSEWGKCSGMCIDSKPPGTPNPTQTRTVSCVSSFKGKVDDSNCGPTSNAGAKPPTSRSCNSIPCGAVEYEWTLGGYSGCTLPCATETDIGFQTRTVDCKTINVEWPDAVDPIKCSDHVKPPTQQQCNTNPCGSSAATTGLRWVVKKDCEPNSCSASCTCTREIKCYLGDTAIDDSICTPENGAPKKPPTIVPCLGGQCVNPNTNAFQWRASDWSPCSVGCGGGVQSRSVRCYANAGYYDDDSKCEELQLAKPATIAQCNRDLCPIDNGDRPSNLEWIIGGWGRCDNETKTQKRWIVCGNTNGKHDDAAKCEAHVGPQPATTRKCDPIPFDSVSWSVRDSRQAFTWYLQEDRWGDPAKWCGGGQIYRYAWCLGLDGRVAESRKQCNPATKPAEERECFQCDRPCPATATWYPGEYWMGCTTRDPCCGTEHRHVFCAGVDGTRQTDTSICTAGGAPATTRSPCGECPPGGQCGQYPRGFNGNAADGPALPGSGVTGAPAMPPNGPAPTTSSMTSITPSLIAVLMCLFVRLFW